MILELNQKLHMSWLVVKLVDHLTLATLAVITKIEEKKKAKLKVKNLIFYPILVLVCMAMRTRQNFKKHLTL